jgi:hypothetical protein
MRRLISFLVLIASLSPAFGQYTYVLKGDSVEFIGRIGPDSCEMILENHTQGVTGGWLYNTGNGRTVFKHPVTSLNDSVFLIGNDTIYLHVPNNSWVQGGNSFGATGIIGTKDNHSLSVYVSRNLWMLLDNGNHTFFNGVTTYSGFFFDGAATARFSNKVTVGNSNTGVQEVSMNPDTVIFDDTIHGSVVAMAGGGYFGVNKSAFGNIPQGSLLMGDSTSTAVTAMVDYSQNPVFVVNNNGSAVINGGYSSIDKGGTVGLGNNANAPSFAINGGRGTGNSVTGDILISTDSSIASGTTIHPMVNRWWIKGGNGFLSNNSSPTSLVDITGVNGYSQFGLRASYTPTSSSDTNGNQGNFCNDNGYLYIKTSSGWKRTALSTF